MEKLPHTRALTPRDGYRLWAPTYDAESALTVIEDLGVRTLTPAPTRETRLLDAGCGTARRLARYTAGSALAAGIDLVPEMLAHGRNRAAPDTFRPLSLALAAADLRALPFPDRTFDLVWCRLALGHLQHLDVPYHELARVSDDHASIIITDFHPRAAQAGYARTFRDAAGTLHAVQHYRHVIADHHRAASAAGLRLYAAHDLVVGPETEPHYRAAGLTDRYLEQRGEPMVLLLRFRR